MFIDYKSQVLLAYKRKRDAKNLSPLLMNPTPGNLRLECANLCHEKFDKRDQVVLRTFFGPHENQKAYIKTITKFGVDKFRPLLKFITEKTADTEIKNLELLAWLVDFEPRPFHSNYSYDVDETDVKQPNQKDENAIDDIMVNPEVERDIIEDAVAKPDEVIIQSVSKQPIDKRYTLIAVFVLFFIATTGYWILKASPAQNGCMYWAVDHYKAVACDEPINNALVIAADSNKLRHFKKIMRPDTITSKALGHVWYSKINNRMEYFTADGNHPIQMSYHLKPLTQYMIEKHINAERKDSITAIR